MATTSSSAAAPAAAPALTTPRPLLPDPYVPHDLENVQVIRPDGDENMGRLLLVLAALDKIPGTDIFGLDYDTAIEACAINCGNRFDGRLACMMPDGSCDRALVKRPANGLLLPGRYCFFTPEQPQVDDESVPPVWDYPVVKEFRDWSFPQTLPFRWANAKYEFRPSLCPSPGPSCCLTFSTYSTDEAHLIPNIEVSWFNENQMFLFDGGIGSVHNILALRTDLHRQFDKAHFAFIPKHSTNTMVCHFLTTKHDTGGELVRDYHNVPMSVTDNVRQFFFARFAWSIFKQPLVLGGLKMSSREFKILVKSKEVVMKPSEMNPNWGPTAGAGASSSSKRRRATTTTADDGAKDSIDSSEGGSSSSSGGGGYQDAWHPTPMDPADAEARYRQLDDWLVTLPEQQQQ